MKRVFIVNSVRLPSIQELSEGALPHILLRWPLHRDQLPQHIQDELKVRDYEGLPTVNINIPFNGGAVKGLKNILELVMQGNRVGIEVDYEDAEMRLTGKTTTYIDVCPHSLNMKDIKILPSPWDAEEGSEEDKEYARMLNQAIREATDKRMARRNITTSGTVGGGEIIDDTSDVISGNTSTDSVF